MLEMAELGAMNSDNQVIAGESGSKEEDSIKKEPEVTVKPEPQECAVCVARAGDCLGIYTTRTVCGTSLNDFLCKFTHRDQVTNSSKHVCKNCYELINVFEQAELEYFKLKETFEAIISKNPLFEQTPDVDSRVKVELKHSVDRDDSEDEPLSLTKKKRHRKVVKRKKPSVAKRKPRAKASEKTSWECEVGFLDEDSPALRDVKKEDSPDRSEPSPFDNGLDTLFKIEIDDFDDDDNSSNYIPDEISNGEKSRAIYPVGRPRKSKLIPAQRLRKKRESKVVHQCDQCDAKYTSLRRLEVHKQKHQEGKPPYICEVCGARYKHKRACDIHVALHKGISDWKCEECNKLFPSKGALQRHNNIHTGKLNYQCDLCGKSFIHTSSFKMHKLSHSGVKPHSCDVCGLALMTRSHLKRHKRVHSGEKRHECAVCGKRFSERYNLVAHSKSHEDAAAGAGGAGAAVPAAPRRRLFRCPFCPERYERRYMLERHTAAAHGRTLERAPPTPRNTMSKLLKAQAQTLRPASAARLTPLTPASDVTDTKEERSPDSRASTTTQKLQLSTTSTITAGSWSGAYAAEFGLRDYAH